MGLTVTKAGLSGPVIGLCRSRTVGLRLVAPSLNLDVCPESLGLSRFLEVRPGNWKWARQKSLEPPAESPIKAAPHKNAPISRSWRLTNFATLRYGMTRLFHCASKHNPGAFRTSISCRFGLRPPSTETPQSQTSSGFSWLMKRKHLTAREHREGKRELWGRGM